MDNKRSTANILVLRLITILIVFGDTPVTSAQAVATEPSVVQAIPPNYPPLALAAHVEGEVTVEARINPQGDVTATKMISGHRLLSLAAEKAARRWKFNPLEQGVNERTVRLYFKFTMVPGNGIPDDIVTIFRPPHRVEVKDTPGRIVTTKNVDPANTKSKGR